MVKRGQMGTLHSALPTSGFLIFRNAKETLHNFLSTATPGENIREFVSVSSHGDIKTFREAMYSFKYS